MIIVNEKKCVECGEKGFQKYEGEFRCEKHHSDAKRKASIKFERRSTIIKCAVVVGSIIGIVGMAIVIYQFVANLQL